MECAIAHEIVCLHRLNAQTYKHTQFYTVRADLSWSRRVCAISRLNPFPIIHAAMGNISWSVVAQSFVNSHGAMVNGSAPVIGGGNRKWMGDFEIADPIHNWKAGEKSYEMVKNCKMFREWYRFGPKSSAIIWAIKSKYSSQKKPEISLFLLQNYIYMDWREK